VGRLRWPLKRGVLADQRPTSTRIVLELAVTMVSKYPLQIERAVRFLLIGVLSFLAYLGVLSIVIDLLRGSVTLGVVAGFAVGTAVSYVGNALWAFDSRMTTRSAGKFLIVIAVGLIANILIARTMEYLGFHYFAITVAIFVIVPALNFLGHHLWTFQEGRYGKPDPAKL
jgi:putative flippase GtrA